MDFIHQVQPYITEDEIAAVTEYLRSGGWLTEFRKTKEFEKLLADFLGKKYIAVVTSGTVALYISLLASGIGRRDKVLVPNYTMIATINAVKWTGAEPVIVDIEESTLCLDVGKNRPDSSCKAMIYVSINGRSGNMAEVIKFCKDNNLLLIEDACQSLGSKWNRKYLGTFGDIGVFSFTPHKIITTGQGGALVSNNEEVFRNARKIKDFHRTSDTCDWYDGIGYNFKFTDLQAVIGIKQMEKIDFRIKQKKEIFKKYQGELGNLQEVKFLSTNLETTTPWFVDVLLPSREMRDKLADYLRLRNIGTRAFYPPINHQKPYSYYPEGSFPISESIVYRGLWLPSSIDLNEDKIDYVCKKVKEFFLK